LRKGLAALAADKDEKIRRWAPAVLKRLDSM
jgi:hypothetical protein